MKNDLTCEVVQDLLPLYVEDLVHAETRKAVDRHLKTCPDCTARKKAMETPETAAGPGDADRQELDYLRSVRRKTRKRVLLAVVGTAAALLALMAVKAFWIGKAADLNGMVWDVTETETGLHIQVDSEWSGVAYVGWRQQQEDNSWSLDARQVLPLPGLSSARYDTDVTITGSGTVTLCGETIWQDGVTVRPQTLRIWKSKTPYMGSPSALMKVAQALEIPQECGGFTSSLQSGKEPYGWTLEFTGFFTQREADQLNYEMERKACQILALVGNLGEVSWTYRLDSGEKQTNSLSLTDEEEFLQDATASYNRQNQAAYPQYEDVKTYGEDTVKFQILCDVLS